MSECQWLIPLVLVLMVWHVMMSFWWCHSLFCHSLCCCWIKTNFFTAECNSQGIRATTFIMQLSLVGCIKCYAPCPSVYPSVCPVLPIFSR